MSRAAADPQSVLDIAIAAYLPSVAAVGVKCIDTAALRYPTANHLVYDNYNALAVAFASGETATSAIFSLTFYPRWVSLFFGRGVDLDDPQGLLQGTGSRVRHVVIDHPGMMDHPPIAALLEQAVVQAQPPLPASGVGQLLIKSQVAKKRARRPKI